MGADLYIETKGKGPVPSDGYFRDSYNATSVLWTLGLSWWEDVLPLLNEEGHLDGLKLVDFRMRVAEARQKFPKKEELIANHAAVSTRGENTVKGWRKYYSDKRARLVEFLDYAIKNKLPVICSL